VPIGDLTLQELLDALGARTPTPGGGAVAPVLAALGGALGRMVIRYTEGKPKFAEHEDLLQAALGALASQEVRCLDVAEEDAKAYAHLSELMKLDKDDARRRAEWGDAVAAAIDAPRKALNVARTTLNLLEELVGKTSRMLASDLAIAALVAECAARAAAWNVRINLPLLEDASEAQETGSRTDATVEEARAISDRITSACARRT
jgi:formiminotetrahydrofolate cyclodeaminase